MADAGVERRGRWRGFRVDQVSRHLHFAHSEHVNWAVYVGDDGVTLVDSGYPGQRDLLVASLVGVGCRPDDVSAVLITHGHVDHLGGAAWLAEEYGTPVFAHADEVGNVNRTELEQAGSWDVVGNILRPGVLPWAVAILPLVGIHSKLGVPSVAPLPMLDDGRVAVPGRPRARLVEGHTTGHTAFDFEDERVLVVGDALATRHRTSPLAGPQLLPSVFHHEAEDARASVANLRSSSARVVLPGHGEACFGPVDAAVDLALRTGWAW